MMQLTESDDPAQLEPFRLGTSLLIIEDEPYVRERLTRHLSDEGFHVRFALDRAEILRQVEAGVHDAIILDLGLPGDDGVSIATAVRQKSGIPILMLTGRADIKARVMGFEAGADDYLIKPYAREELVARLKALLRRAHMGPTGKKSVRSLSIGGAVLEMSTGLFSGPLGSCHLTAKESRLFVVLCSAQGVLSREATYREVFARKWDPQDRSLDVHIANLRRKLHEVCGEAASIVTVRGEGYEVVGERSFDIHDPAH